MEEKINNKGLKDETELLIGNTHRCANCGQAVDMTNPAPDKCTGCGETFYGHTEATPRYTPLIGLEECLGYKIREEN